MPEGQAGQDGQAGQGTAAPVLETERLRLRGHRPADLPACAAMWGNPEVTRFLGGQAASEGQTWTRVLIHVGHWAWLGFGYWVIEERGSGAFVGELGFADFRRDLVPPIIGIPEAGWVLTPRMQGKGYATEALRAALAWADARLPASRTVCIIDPENARSARVAVRCGYRHPQVTTFRGRPTVLYERPRPALNTGRT